ncbi:MAG: sugar phosphate isomerase/epimerase [Chloroflexota bacterium]|nr:sugar phosphate isomerase/epimerase [Chloroflexota bacterium]
MSLLLWTGDVTPAHAGLLESLKGWGFDFAELPLLSNTDEANYRALRQILDDLGLERTLNAGASAAHNPIDPDPTVRRAALEHFRRVIAICAILGVSILNGPFTAPVNGIVGRPRTADEWGRAVEVFRELAPYAAEHGVVMAHEYLNRFQTYFLNCMADSIRFAEAVGHPSFALIYDTYHGQLEEKSHSDAIRTGGRRIAYVQISESDRSTPGSGQVPWDDVFGALKGIDYDGWLSIEAFGPRPPAVATLTRTWRQMFPSEEQVAVDGLRFMRERWERSG